MSLRESRRSKHSSSARPVRNSDRPAGPYWLRRFVSRRENDGSFLLHLTLHQPSQQPLDTLYTLRLDPGRQTVVTLIFIREAFGYKEPLFPPAMLDEFMLQKLDAHRTK